jgi:hypothetical protein
VVFSKAVGFSLTILENKVKINITNEYEDEDGAFIM